MVDDLTDDVAGVIEALGYLGVAFLVVGLLQTAVILGIVVLLGLLVWKRVLGPRLAAAGDLPPPDDEG